MTDKRRKFTSHFKAEVLLEALKNKKAIAEICEQNSIHVTQFYAWQKEAFDRFERLFEVDSADHKKEEQAQVRELKERLQSKTIFCKELLEEHAKLKKSLGEI